MRQNVEEVYGWIVDDVVTKVRDVFAEEGIDVSVLNELRETWSRKLDESGAMGNNSHGTDVSEWATPEKTDKAAVAARPIKTSPVSYPPSHRMNSSTAESVALRGRLSIGIPQKRVEAVTPYTARTYLPREAAVIWPPPPANQHVYQHYPGTGTFMASMSRQQPSHVISSSQATPQPVRASTGIMDTRLLMNSLYSTGNTTTPTRSQPIRVIPNDNAFHLHHFTPLTTSASPQVRLSGKRKGPDDPASLVSHNASTKAVRRKSSDSKTSSVIPQRDGADERPIPAPQHSEQEEPDLDDDSTLSDGDDEEDAVESSNCLTAQYDKVSRIKNRWRCQLKHGIFHIDGKDYLFKSANGEFTF